jgi:hypothetical protein
MSKDQSTYDSDAAAALKLSAPEREAAKALLAKRPPVVPGTRAIVSRAKAVVWFDEVSAEMKRLGIASDGIKTAAFCDLAGVPD